MGGLIFLAAVGIWTFISLFLARWLLGLLKVKRLQTVTILVLTVTIFLLPVADELAARPEFNRLCKKAAALRIDAERINGRTVQVILQVLNEKVQDSPLPILHSKLALRDTKTDEVLGSYDTYSVRGGVLARWIGWPEGESPWTYGKAGCGPNVDWNSLPNRYGFKLIK